MSTVSPICENSKIYFIAIQECKKLKVRKYTIQYLQLAATGMYIALLFVTDLSFTFGSMSASFFF